MSDDIATWYERCDRHPDHQSGMVTNGMIQARMQEEINDLREEVERLTAERDALLTLLAELTALVRGECPALLDEDRGGNAQLSLEIDAAMAKEKRDE